MKSIGIARPSVASLFLEPHFGDQQLSVGTGFLVEGSGATYLVTNWHVVTGRNPTKGQPLHPSGAVPDRIKVFHNASGKLGEWVDHIEDLYEADGSPRWLEHPRHLKGQVDVVVLPLTQLTGIEIYSYDPAPPASDMEVAVRVSDAVNIIGFPFGLTGGGKLAVWVRGTIATEPEVDWQGLPVFLIDSRTRSGQSGSPVIFYSAGGTVNLADGSVAVTGGVTEILIGVYSGRISDQSDLGFVWKASTLVEILDAQVHGQRP